MSPNTSRIKYPESALKHKTTKRGNETTKRGNDNSFKINANRVKKVDKSENSIGGKNSSMTLEKAKKGSKGSKAKNPAKNNASVAD